MWQLYFWMKPKKYAVQYSHWQMSMKATIPDTPCIFLIAITHPEFFCAIFNQVRARFSNYHGVIKLYLNLKDLLMVYSNLKGIWPMPSLNDVKIVQTGIYLKCSTKHYFYRSIQLINSSFCNNKQWKGKNTTILSILQSFTNLSLLCLN